jgi:hypothetical protein
MSYEAYTAKKLSEHIQELESRLKEAEKAGDKTKVKRYNQSLKDALEAYGEMR